jgi:putative membrane protein
VSAPTLPALLVSHWELQPGPCAAAVIAGGVYVGAASRLARRWPLHRTLAFLGGLVCGLAAVASGLGTYDDRLLSAHMAQHMLLLLAAPLLLLGGHPLGLALRTLHGRRRRRLARGLERVRPMTRPWWCLAAFSAIVLLTHLPAFYDATLRHATLHDGEHALYLVAGALFWWPLLDGDPALAHRLGGLGRLLYLLAGMVPMALIGAYLNRHTSVAYGPYREAAHGLGVSALGDQASAGALMWVVGDTVMAAAGLWAVMAALSAEERRHQSREAYAGPDPEGALRP